MNPNRCDFYCTSNQYHRNIQK